MNRIFLMIIVCFCINFENLLLKYYNKLRFIFPKSNRTIYPYRINKLNTKHTIKDMQKLAKERGGKCLSKKYLGIHEYINWKCNKGHKWKARPSNVINGTWCPKCADLKRNDNIKFTIEDLNKIAQKKGGKCLTKKYINGKQKVKWQCSNGHIWETTPAHIKNGEWCIECKKGKLGYNKKGTIDEMNKIANEKGGKCLSDKYIKNTTKLKLQCKEGHIWEATPYQIKNQDKWCPVCAKKIN